MHMLKQASILATLSSRAHSDSRAIKNGRPNPTDATLTARLTIRRVHHRMNPPCSPMAPATLQRVIVNGFTDSPTSTVRHLCVCARVCEEHTRTAVGVCSSKFGISLVCIYQDIYHFFVRMIGMSLRKKVFKACNWGAEATSEQSDSRMACVHAGDFTTPHPSVMPLLLQTHASLYALLHTAPNPNSLNHKLLQRGRSDTQHVCFV